MEMQRVSRREFQQYTSKYLKELPIIVTMRGIDDFIVREVREHDGEGTEETNAVWVQGSDNTA